MCKNVIGCGGRHLFSIFMGVPLYSLRQFLIWPSSTYFYHVSLLGEKSREKTGKSFFLIQIDRLCAKMSLDVEGDTFLVFLWVYPYTCVRDCQLCGGRPVDNV